MRYVKKNRIDEMKALTEQLEEGIQDTFRDEKFTKYLRTMSRFHKYSVNNSLLINMQYPGASRVAGFTTWKRLGRHVKANEKGIKLIGCSAKKAPKKDDSGNIVKDTNGKPVMEETGEFSFRPIYVFDLGQTDGKALPEEPHISLDGSVQCFEKMMNALSDISSTIDVSQESQELSQTQMVKTAVGLVSSSMMEKRGVNMANRALADTISEAVSYVVCQHFDIDTSECSFVRICEWAEGKPIATLKENLDLIHELSNEIIDKIIERF